MGIELPTFIILAVVVPLIAAPIAAIVSSRYSFFVALFATFASFYSVLSLFLETSGLTKISYYVGGFAPPVGIEYQANSLNITIAFLITSVASLVIIYSYANVKKEIEKHKISLVYTLYLLFLAGLLGIIFTNDFFNLYVFIEIASLSIYSLIAAGKDRKALLSSFQYLILGTIGSTFVLIGIGLLYMVTGTLNFSDLAAKIPMADGSKVVAAAVAFIVAGLLLKTGIFPFHIWMVNSYTYSPSFISTLMCGTSSKVMMYVLIKVIFLLFGLEHSLKYMMFENMLLVIGAAAVLYGSIAPIYNNNVNKIFAYSSISFLGLILLAIALGSKAGLTAAIILILYHAIAKVGIFMATGIISHARGDVKLTTLHGLKKRNFLISAALFVCVLSVAGIPGTAGFVAKFYFVGALIDAKAYLVLAITILGFALSLIYSWRVLEAAFIVKPKEMPERIKAPRTMLIPFVFVAGLNIYFGISSYFTVKIASNITYMIMGN